MGREGMGGSMEGRVGGCTSGIASSAGGVGCREETAEGSAATAAGAAFTSEKSPSRLPPIRVEGSEGVEGVEGVEVVEGVKWVGLTRTTLSSPPSHRTTQRPASSIHWRRDPMEPLSCGGNGHMT